MSTIKAFLFISTICCCYGIPSEKEILDSIEQATAQNALKRGVVSLMSEDKEPKVNSCPHMLANFHGRRTSTEKEADQNANNLLGAAQLLVKKGHSLKDLQNENVRKIFNSKNKNCPSKPKCTPAASPKASPYRTADGSCNNQANPEWGQAGQAQIRVAPAAYDDGISVPRKKSVLGSDLPNPRTVSNKVHAAPQGSEIRSNKITLHTFQMGQFLDHDIIATPAQSTVSDCCSSEGKADNGNCLPIICPENDARFSEYYCMNFRRSAPIFCPSVSTQREQSNAITSFIDASNVYGSSDAETSTLRDNGGTGPFLRTEAGDRLPKNPDDTACSSNGYGGAFCSLAGDHRVDVVPSLTSYHTLFVREHNRIARALQSYYTNDETLFQETRKVLIGVMQKIVYDEFLPAFMSPAAVTKYRLESSNAYSYSAKINPTISNGFGIAYRMGHSWIPRNMDVFHRDLTLLSSVGTVESYFNPSVTFRNYSTNVNGLEGLAYRLTAENSPDTDRFVEDVARNSLFEDKAGDAFDLVALNIQRGRDHGLPSYNAYRAFCGLSQLPSSWTQVVQGGLVDHSGKIAWLLETVYASPLDIDLFTGALTETPTTGGNLGPTLDCLLGDQFEKLKYGDRFWYQNPDSGFTPDLQAEIQKASMARILCDNYNFDKVHSNAFLDTNLVPCDSIPKMDLSKFDPSIGDTDTGPKNDKDKKKN